MLKNILLGLVAIVAILAIVVAMQPAQTKVERKIAIDAPVETVFPHINTVRKWDAWSPWAKLDPNAKVSFEGPDSGVGASFSWVGNEKVGEGKLTVVESVPNERVKLRLDFKKPMEASSFQEFTFKPELKQTAVSWNMTCENNFVSKAVQLCFVNLEKEVGEPFEKGLANIKSVAEAESKK